MITDTGTEYDIDTDYDTDTMVDCTQTPSFCKSQDFHSITTKNLTFKVHCHTAAQTDKQTDKNTTTRQTNKNPSYAPKGRAERQGTYKLEHLVRGGVDGDVDVFARRQVGGRDGLHQEVQPLLRLVEHRAQGSRLADRAMGCLPTHITQRVNTHPLGDLHIALTCQTPGTMLLFQ